MPGRPRTRANTRGRSSAGSVIGVRLHLQRLPGPTQVLAVGALAAVQQEDRTFSTAALVQLYRDLRLPAPANPSASLSRLSSQGLLLRPRKDGWALTPEGEHHLSRNAAHVPSNLLAAELERSVGTEFGERTHTLIPPFLAPAGTEVGLDRLWSRSEFDANVMLIARFPTGPEDPVTRLVARLREACGAHGLSLQLASDGNAADTLWQNVVTYMWGSKYGIVILDRVEGVLNSNVLIELGAMLVTGRRCAILRDSTVPKMPTDLVGHIYRSVDLSDHESVEREVHQWITNDLSFPRCPSCPNEASAPELAQRVGRSRDKPT